MKKIFFISAIILVSSIVAFAQKNDSTPKPTPPPPIIRVPEKPKPTPKPEKPSAITIDLFFSNIKKQTI